MSFALNATHRAPICPQTREIKENSSILQTLLITPSFHRAGTGMYPVFCIPLNASSLIKCTDCHNNDDSFGPKGPHGSNYEHILKKNFTLIGGIRRALINMSSATPVTEERAYWLMKAFFTMTFTSLLSTLPAGHAIILTEALSIVILLNSTLWSSVRQARGISNSETWVEKPENVI